MAEKLVTTAAAISLLSDASSANRKAKAVIVQNLGPNAIWIEVDGSTPVANKSLKLAAGAVATWEGEMCQTMNMKAIASSADQVTTAATIVQEIF